MAPKINKVEKISLFEFIDIITEGKGDQIKKDLIKIKSEQGRKTNRQEENKTSRSYLF